MKKPMIIIERESKISDEVKDWAKRHSVPVICMENESLRSADTERIISDYDYVIEYSEEITLDQLEIAYCHATGKPAVINRSVNLTIREIGMDDAKDYQRILESCPEAVSDKTLLNLSYEAFIERHKAYIKYSYGFLGYGIYGIYLNNEGSPKMIGIAGLDGTETPVLSYALLKGYRGRGYAFEACSMILEYVMSDLDLDKINVFIPCDNTRSINLAKKLLEKYPVLQISYDQNT